MAEQESTDKGEPKKGASTGRRVVIALVAVALVVLALGVALALFVDVERFRGPIERAVESRTGWEAEIGELDLSILRGFALTVSPLSLRAPGEDSSRIALDTLAIEASILPLLSGRLEVHSIVLEAPEIVLVRPAGAEDFVLPTGGAKRERAGAAPRAGDDAPREAPQGEGAERDPGAGEESAEEGGLAVSVDAIDIDGGRLVVDDRAATPPRRIELVDVSATMSPDAGRLSGSARLADTEGRLSVEREPGEPYHVALESLPSEALIPFLGEGLLHPGARLSGDTRVSTGPLAAEGTLRAESLRVLAGEEPIDAAEARFEARAKQGSEGLELLSLVLTSGPVRLEGRGSLTPALDLSFTIPETEIEPALKVARGAFPVPLDVEGPGTVGATIEVDMPEGGALSYAVDGRAKAATVRAAGPLPPARKVSADFRVERSGRLVVDILEGRAAEGTLSGQARLEPLVPPGRFLFDGGLEDATLGGLLSGLLPAAEGKIGGRSRIDARVGLDLTSGKIDPSALGGRIDLASVNVGLPGWNIERALLDALDERLGDIGAIANLIGGDVQKGVQELEEGAAEPAGEERLFEVLEGIVDLDTRPWSVRDFRLESGDVAASGAGSFDPFEGKVDFSLSARLSPEKTQQLVAKQRALRFLVDKEGRLSFPLRVEGAMLSPKLGVDLKQLVASPEDQAKRELEERAKEELGGLLEGFLGGRKKDDQKKKEESQKEGGGGGS